MSDREPDLWNAAAVGLGVLAVALVFTPHVAASGDVPSTLMGWATRELWWLVPLMVLVGWLALHERRAE